MSVKYTSEEIEIINKLKILIDNNRISKNKVANVKEVIELFGEGHIIKKDNFCNSLLLGLPIKEFVEAAKETEKVKEEEKKKEEETKKKEEESKKKEEESKKKEEESSLTEELKNFKRFIK